MKAQGKWTIHGLFAKRPGTLRLFHMVKRYIVSLGPVKIEAAKTQVSFGLKRKCAWVWLPPAWAKRPENCIVLSFSLVRRIQDRRIEESVQPYPGRWMHHVIIEKESDFDKKVRKWLKEAHGYGQGGKSKRS